MNRLATLFVFAASVAAAQEPLTVIPINYNSNMIKVFQGMGFMPANAQPTVVVMLSGGPVSDGHRVVITCTRTDGSSYLDTTDTMASVVTFGVDCVSPVTVSAGPYTLVDHVVTVIR